MKNTNNIIKCNNDTMIDNKGDKEMYNNNLPMLRNTMVF